MEYFYICEEGNQCSRLGLGSPLVVENSPLVTVAVPVRNEERYVVRALRSLKSQTFEDFRVIVSDNFSTDRSRDLILDEIAEDDRFELVVPETELSVSQHFDWLRREYDKSPLFSFLAADDYYESQFLETCVRIMASDDTAHLCFTHFREIHTYGLGEVIQPSPSIFGRPFLSLLTQIMNSRPHAIYGLWRTSALNKVSLPDWDMGDVHVVRQIAAGGNLRIFPGDLFRYSREKNRLPYSVQGRRKIKSKEFLRAEKMLFDMSIGGVRSRLLRVINVTSVSNSVRRANRMIGKNRIT